MKVIESQAAVLTNYEVYQHLVEQQRANKSAKRRGPPNFENVVKELLQYLRTEPSPLSQQPVAYSPKCIAQLLERLRPYDLSKGEVIMVLNLRPASVAALNTVVEDMGERFSEEQQEEMVGIVAEVLGEFAPKAPQEEGANGDVAMEDAAVS